MTSEIIKLILGSAAIKALVGARVYPVALATVKDPTYPCVAIDRGQSAGAYSSKQSQIGETPFRVTSCSKNPDEAETIQGYVITQLNGQSIGTTDVSGVVLLIQPLTLYSDEDQIYYATNGFSFRGKIQ